MHKEEDVEKLMIERMEEIVKKYVDKVFLSHMRVQMDPLFLAKWTAIANRIHSTLPTAMIVYQAEMYLTKNIKKSINNAMIEANIGLTIGEGEKPCKRK